MIRLIALLPLLFAVGAFAAEPARQSPSGCGGPAPQETVTDDAAATGSDAEDPARPAQPKKPSAKTSPLGSSPNPAEPSARLRWSSFLPGMFR